MLVAVVLQIVIAILINAFIAIAIDRAQRVVQLHTNGIALLVVGIFTGVVTTHGRTPFCSVDRLQHTGIHLFQQIAVLGHINTEVGRELTCLHKLLGSEIQLPTVIGHSAHIGIGH